jgi:hypothetical protein
MAIGLVKVYDKNTRDVINDLLIVRYVPFIGMDCLELSAHCQCTSFLALNVIQHIFNNIWNGQKQDYSRLVSGFLLLFFS